MVRLGFVFMLLVLCNTVLGQDASSADNSRPPYSSEHTAWLSEFLKSFEVIETPESIPDTVEQWLKWHTVDNYQFGKNRGSIPMIADLAALHPYFRDKIIELIAICKAKGIELAIVETYRTKAKQNEYKAMGKKYTRSGGGHSKHQYGLAIDVVPIIDSLAEWHNDLVWRKIGLAGERLGLRWGGRWRYPYDPGHFEWTGGLSSNHLSQGTNPAVPKPISYPCIKEDLTQLKEFWNAWETEQAAIAKSRIAIQKGRK